MKIIEINKHLTGFYFNGDSSPDTLKTAVGADENWAIGGCNALGVCCYVIHDSKSALVCDTLAGTDQAKQVRSYLEGKGITSFTVAISHWHLDHVGGNEVFADSVIISNEKTRAYLAEYKEGIENATLWGEPAIAPLVLPNLTYHETLNFYVGDLEVQMSNLNIHSDDSSYYYIPQYKFLLTGDMLEDSCPFIVNPADIPTHVQNLAQMRKLDVDRIYPNHGSCFNIEKKGYGKDFIDAASEYLSTMHEMVEKDPKCEEPGLREFIKKYLDKNTLRYWEPYESVHLGNFRRCKAYITDGWTAADGL